VISCDCSCDCYDGPEFSREAWRKARKQHECVECGETINPGDRYEYSCGVWDGSWDDHHTCAPCVAIRSHYCPGGFCYGELAQQIDECLGFDYREVPEDDDEGDWE